MGPPGELHPHRGCLASPHPHGVHVPMSPWGPPDTPMSPEGPHIPLGFSWHLCPLGVFLPSPMSPWGPPGISVSPWSPPATPVSPEGPHVPLGSSCHLHIPRESPCPPGDPPRSSRVPLSPGGGRDMEEPVPVPHPTPGWGARACANHGHSPAPQGDPRATSSHLRDPQDPQGHLPPVPPPQQGLGEPFLTASVF